MAGKRVKVIEENNEGRNELFQDTSNGNRMTRAEFVRKIKKGDHPNYHVRKINGIDTPVSNPDKSEGNNLD